MTVVTRFAPSPTGFLHIGGARTALFNWLFARHHGGQFLLRIEDTDRARSTEAAEAAIHEGLTWLGLDWDGDAFSQFARRDRHAEVAQTLLARGHAYRCYCSAEELAEMRDKARAEGRPVLYDGRWRDRDPAEAPEDVDPVIRLKMPREGETVIEDAVQGRVAVANETLDDLILLRSDGTPTYMLAVVVDDHDMGVTHVIRGDDHLTNAFRQTQIFRAMDWDLPTFAHIPLIHGPDGAKLSKRHGALGVEAYRDMGYLPAAMRNYLLRLGWSHGDEEVISTEQAVAWFDLPAVGKSPARFDFDKLNNLNALYLRDCPEAELAAAAEPELSERLGAPLDPVQRARIEQVMGHAKSRAKLLTELAEAGWWAIAPRPLDFEAKAAKLLGDEARALLADLEPVLRDVTDWSLESAEEAVRGFAAARTLKLGAVAQPLRAALTGRAASPGIFDVLAILGREESLARLADIRDGAGTAPAGD